MSNQLQTNLDAILQDKNTNLLPENLRQGVTCLGVEGTMQSGVDTSDANAAANDITIDKTAYVNGEKVTGTLPLFPNTRTFTVSNAGVTNNTEDSTLDLTTINTTKQILDSNVSMNFNADYSDVATAIGLTADKITSGNTILGIEGIVDPEGVQISDYFNTAPEDGQSLLKAYPDTIDCSKLTYFNFFSDFQNTYVPNLINTENVNNLSNIASSNTLGFTQTELDVSSVSDFTDAFNYFNNMTSAPKLKNLLKNNFYDGFSLSMIGMYRTCTNLETIPEFEIIGDWSIITMQPNININEMVNSCPKLSEQSITNILNFLKLLNDHNAQFDVYTLSDVGLSYSQLTNLTEDQLAIINSMDGWTTGLELYTTEIEIGELYALIGGSRMIPTNITLQNYLNIVETKRIIAKWQVWVYADYMHLETLEFTSSSDLITSLNSLKFKTSNETISVNIQINGIDETGSSWTVISGYENTVQANSKTAINLLLAYLPVNININTKTKDFDDYYIELLQVDDSSAMYGVFDDFMNMGGYLPIDVNTILTTSIQDVQPYKFKINILSPDQITANISCVSNSFTEENLTMTFDIEEVVLEDVSAENTIITNMILYPQSEDTQFTLLFDVSGEIHIEDILLYNNDIQLEWSVDYGTQFSDGTYMVSSILLTGGTNVSDITAYSYGPAKENDTSL